jgi:hypothetical protein
VFNATFSNISAISWQPVLVVEEAGENHRPLCNSSHLEWRAGLSDTILKGTHPAKFGSIWFRGFKGEDLNVKVYDVRWTPSDGKSSPGLWPRELKTLQRKSHAGCGDLKVK